MRGTTLRNIVVLTLVILAGLPGIAPGACPGDDPQVVLACFSMAYSDRDKAMLDDVLAPDYMWVAVAPPEVEVFTREDSYSASLKMFGDPEMESVTLEFLTGYDVVEGSDEKTWRIENLKAIMTVKRASMPEPSVASLCVTLYVRQTTGDNPGYEVYREVFFEGDGCEGK